MTVHVIGAGIAGLACATRLAKTGTPVAIYEQNRTAGGRCRSYFDQRLARTVDTGIHLTFARSTNFRAFLDDIGAADQLVGPDASYCRFVDIVSGRDWTLRPNAGPVPWWLMVPWRSPPQKGFADIIGLVRLASSDASATVAACVPTDGATFRNLWEPITVACLNTKPAHASAQLLWRFIRDGISNGSRLYHQRFPRGPLSECFIDPALAALRARDGRVNLRERLLGLEFAGDRIVALSFASRRVALDRSDAVVLALPPKPAARLVPSLAAPERSSAIITAHFALRPPAPPAPDLTCVIEGRSIWLLVRHDVATATIGAADDMLHQSSDAIARKLWSAIAVVLGRDGGQLPPHRVLKFRDGTYAHTPTEVARRPSNRTRWTNLFLAGDWTASEFPATVDSAAHSGHLAAAAAGTPA